MNKFWNFVKNEDTGEQILRIEGVISNESYWYDDLSTPKKFRSELNLCEGDITVWLNSEGGDFFAATTIYNMLKEYAGKVTIKIESLAASAASVIAMAGDTVEISSLGMMMIHNPFSYAEGSADELKAAAEMLSEVKEVIIDAYEKKTKLPREQLSQMMDDETWFPAQKAVELGFCDKIIGEENPSPTNSFSRQQILNCLRENFKPQRSRNVTSLRRRLALATGGK